MIDTCIVQIFISVLLTNILYSTVFCVVLGCTASLLDGQIYDRKLMQFMLLVILLVNRPNLHSLEEFVTITQKQLV